MDSSVKEIFIWGSQNPYGIHEKLIFKECNLVQHLVRVHVAISFENMSNNEVTVNNGIKIEELLWQHWKNSTWMTCGSNITVPDAAQTEKKFNCREVSEIFTIKMMRGLLEGQI